jgi:CBS domain-containing protein
MLIRHILAGKGGDVVTTRPDATVTEVAKLLKAKRIGAVVVTDADEELCGIISERDLACGLAEHGANLLGMRVADVMTREISTCSPNDGIDRLMRQMTEGRFRHLPVVEDGRMIGIISIGDVVKNRLLELENEAHMLHDYISGGA